MKRKKKKVRGARAKKSNQTAQSTTISLIDFFRSAPCQEVELDIQRPKDLPRIIEL